MPLTPIREEQRNSGDTYIFSRVGAGCYCNSLIINASIISAVPTLIHIDAGRRSVPVRSGAPQFALWASAADRPCNVMHSWQSTL